jgi:Uri superfamily endonuclease
MQVLTCRTNYACERIPEGMYLKAGGIKRGFVKRIQRLLHQLSQRAVVYQID